MRGLAFAVAASMLLVSVDVSAQDGRQKQADALFQQERGRRPSPAFW
jgi:hypothetical protein